LPRPAFVVLTKVSFQLVLGVFDFEAFDDCEYSVLGDGEICGFSFSDEFFFAHFEVLRNGKSGRTGDTAAVFELVLEFLNLSQKGNVLFVFESFFLWEPVDLSQEFIKFDFELFFRLVFLVDLVGVEITLGLWLSQLDFNLLFVPAEFGDLLFEFFDNSGGLDEIAMKSGILVLELWDGTFVKLKICFEIFHNFLDLLVVVLMPFLFLLEPGLQFMNLLLINRHLLHVGLFLDLGPGVQFHDLLFIPFELPLSNLSNLLLLSV
jgi:hypothetical protein